MNTPVTLSRSQRGLTLIEVMVSVTLGLLLLAALMQVFTSSKATYTTVESMSRLQENARFIADSFAYDIRHAGHSGCVDPAEVRPVVTSEMDDSMADRITGHENGAGLPSWITAVAGTDAITVRYGLPRYARVASTMTSAEEDVEIVADDGLGVMAGSLVLIGSCKGPDVSEIFTVTDVATGSGVVNLAHATHHESEQVNRSASLYSMYAEGARVMLFTERTYFIRDTGRERVDGTPILALARSDGAGQVADIVDGVENLQILYGQRDGDVIRYVPADSVTEFNDVVSVQLGSLLVSSNRQLVNDDTGVYTIAGVNVTPPDGAGPLFYAQDRHVRRVVNITAQMRNQRFDE